MSAVSPLANDRLLELIEDEPRPSVNLARFDLLSMHLVVQCAVRGSITAAARHCHLSVMGASDRLRRLEDALGKPLFHRHRHGVELTEAGHVAARWAKLMVLAANRVVEDVDAATVNAAVRGENPGRRGKAVSFDSPA